MAGISAAMCQVQPTPAISISACPARFCFAALCLVSSRPLEFARWEPVPDGKKRELGLDLQLLLQPAIENISTRAFQKPFPSSGCHRPRAGQSVPTSWEKARLVPHELECHGAPVPNGKKCKANIEYGYPT